MLRSFKSIVIVLVTLALAPAVMAQGTCPAIVQQALDAAGELCTNTGRNQACYGNMAIEAVLQPEVPSLNFDSAGDIADVTAIQTLRLQPMDAASQTWGVAIMRLQANLPGSLPGQNVTFLLFGDVEVTNVVPPEGSDEFTPMQAFLLRTGVGDALCAEAPESGLVVQTPEGVGEVTFNINGVDVGMGSTVVFRAQAEGEMTVSTIEGLAVVEVEDDVRPVLAGTRLRVPMDRALRPFRRLANAPEPYELRNLEGIPLRLLQRRINVASPLTADQVSEIMRRVAAGEPICGEAPLPDCDRVPKELIARALKASRARLEDRLNCVFRRGPRQQMPADETRPFCDTLPPESLPCAFLPGPNDPPLPDTETRPYCPQLPRDTAMRNLRTDNRPCVLRPRPGDPPLPPDETRPFCQDQPRPGERRADPPISASADTDSDRSDDPNQSAAPAAETPATSTSDDDSDTGSSSDEQQPEDTERQNTTGDSPAPEQETAGEDTDDGASQTEPNRTG